jgi:hypothetical protein
LKTFPLIFVEKNPKIPEKFPANLFKKCPEKFSRTAVKHPPRTPIFQVSEHSQSGPYPHPVVRVFRNGAQFKPG